MSTTVNPPVPPKIESSEGDIKTPQTRDWKWGVPNAATGKTTRSITISGKASELGNVGFNQPEPVEVLDVGGNIKCDGQFLGVGACITGMILMFGGANAPTGWVVCNGQALLRADYEKLFAVLGSVYNKQGDDPALFRVPNLSGRFALGRAELTGGVTSKGLGADPSVLGASGGSEGVTLSTANLPAHAHMVGSHSHPADLTINENGEHSHQFDATRNDDGGLQHAHVFEAQQHNPYKTNVGSSGKHSHSGSVNVGGNASFQSGDSGSGQGFSVVPPALVVNYIIKA